MPLPIDISFEDIPHSKAVEEFVTHQVSHLHRICGQIMRCRVSLALGAKHQQQGRPFNVHVGVTMPRQTYLSSKASDTDPYVALREAFAHVERIVVETVRKHRPSADQQTGLTEEA
ncbi:ribosomal subunit interface protein [Ralstonia sp. A12]|uniref:HPF/RaiA family ribosome-associated protein n=1 Tax=Ralstonia sp. A12 TaxID=1217052 RepID=UPI00057390C2|nr:HPF/RaiA family ribosome-associated protein [Ralstonia sp. A12]KHK58279.1 ribosomal subunit interface protein [Ralstonia sp. A12]